MVDGVKFSGFFDGGDLVEDDLVVGLRDGVNTRFSYAGPLPDGTIVPISKGGTGATDAATARTNLGVAIGVDVQAFSEYLADIAAISSPSAGNLIRFDGSDWVKTSSTFADTYGASELLYSNTANTVEGLTTANSAALVTNSSGVPSWTSSLTNNEVLIGSTANTIDSITTANSAILVTNASGVPAWTASITDGELLVGSTADTVTGLTTANSATLVTDASGVASWTASMADGELLIGSTGATPAPATLTAGTGITISNAAGSVTISGGGSGYSWNEITGTSESMAVNNGYIANNASLVTLTLPASATVGDTITTQGKGSGLYRIAQNAGQTIHFGASDTTTGTGGYIEATNRYDSIELICITANDEWAVLTGAQGAFTIV